ncbi:MAG: hypothetical protein H6739_40170 [Alphaproteobacteria bacterium]|nr:hypothetical protein [Alphaproteobacteria bacterium]
MSTRALRLMVATLALLGAGVADAAPRVQPFVGAEMALRRPYLAPIGSGTGAVALRPSLHAGGLLRAGTSAYQLNLGVDGRLYDYIGVAGSPIRAGGRGDLGLKVGSNAALKPVLRSHIEYALEDRIQASPLTLPHLDAGGTVGLERDGGGVLVGSLLFDVNGETWKGSYSGMIIGGRGQLGYRYYPRTEAPALRASASRNLALGATTLGVEAGLTGQVGKRTDVSAWVGWGRLSEGGAKVPLTAPVFGEVSVGWQPRRATRVDFYGKRQLDTRVYSAGDVTNGVGVAGQLQGAGVQALVGGDAVLHQYVGSGLARVDTTLRATAELAWAPGASNRLWTVGNVYTLGRKSSDGSVDGLGWGVGVGVEYWPASGRQRTASGSWIR